MAEWGRSRGRVETWPQPRTRAAVAPWRLADLTQIRSARKRLAQWSAAEIAPGRLVPWLPIAFAFGIAMYFTAEREPSLWAALMLAAAGLGGAVLARRRPVAGPVLIGLFVAMAGFSAATFKSVQIAHPILWHAANNVQVSGFVAVREERERSDRIVVEVHQIEGRKLDQSPNRIRVSVRRGTAPAVGAFISFKARLSAPLEPLRPGGYDFARDLWFQGIGATGYVLGAIKITPAPATPSRWLSYAAFIESLRDSIDQRIRSAISGDPGSIASALITGKRDAISTPVNDAMYISSLAHVLSISGYHIAVVAGVAFFVVRGLLALVPGLAVRRPIKKWAAALALLAATLYLLLSGAEVATQRAYVMTAVVLGGVLVDRPALTMRTLAVAALTVLVISPQAVVHPSFQMSFAATLALVAAYERGLPWTLAGAGTSLGARVALWGGREIAALMFASVVAGLATTLFAAYHFHRLAPYGVLANLLGMPIVSVLVMPAGILALVALPFGFDGPLWRIMGQGIEWMIAVAVWVGSLPGAVGRVTAFGTGALILGTIGLVLICLLRSPLRWLGAMTLVAAIVIAVRTPVPDVYIAPQGDAVAVRGPSGELSVIKSFGAPFAVKEWLAADADPRAPGDPSLQKGTACDAAGCTAQLADGSRVALAFTPEAFEDDCALASLVVTRRTAPQGCAATVIDRAISRNSGALSLRRVDGAWTMTPARPDGHERPWIRQRTPPANIASTVQTTSTPPGRAIPQPDATPRAEDLEPDD